jgi:hypothetical protein
MKTRCLFFVAFICISFSLSAQYNSAVGLRLGYPNSITYKKFLNDNNAIELFGGIRGFVGASSFNASGLYEIHKEIDGVDNLRWYYGGGAGVFFWTYNSRFIGDNSSNISVGLHGVLGLDYAFEDIPLNLSTDWVPTFFLNGYISGFARGYAGLSARYILGQTK